MRTQEEILNRIRNNYKNDLFGFETLDYVRALTRENAESLRGTVLNAEAKLDDDHFDLVSDEAIRKQCIEYMPFAWEKANDCRGLSAGRTMAHYKAWLWLLGQDSFDDLENYEFYGKDNLIRICKFFDLDPKKWDDGVRVNRG